MKHKVAIAVAVVALLAGCASVGNERLASEDEQTIAQKIEIGETTKADVTQMLGAPTSKMFDAKGQEQWMYMHSHASADAVNFIPFAALFGTSTSGETKQLTVVFDDDGVVSNYLMNATDSGIKTGVYSN